MFKNLFFVGLLLGLAGSVQAQNSCPVTLTKSGTGLNRTYTASSNATGATYKISVFTDWVNMDSSNTNTLVVAYNYGGYYDIGVEVVAPNCTSYVSIKDTVTGPINCSLPYSNFSIYPYSSGASSYEQYTVNWYLPLKAPGYTFTRQIDFGDGTTGSDLFHTYIFPQNNTKVTYTATYTHPTFATCTLRDSATINIPLATDATNKIEYLPVAGAGVRLWNTLSAPAAQGYTPITRWYLKNAVTGAFDFQSKGPYLNFLPLPPGNHTIVASTSWYLPNSNIFTMSVDSIQVDVNDGSNHLLLQSNSSPLFAGTAKDIKFTLLKQDATTQLFHPVDSTTVPTESSCNCVPGVSFHKILEGTYIARAAVVGAVAGAGSYLVPTYIDSAASWQQAAPLVFGTGTALETRVQMASTKDLTGKGFIGGTIYESSFSGAPLAGVQILLRDGEGILQKETTTDAGGNFAFSGLPDGSYEVYPEELNFRVQRPASILLREELNTLIDRRNFVRDVSERLYRPDVPSGVNPIFASSIKVTPNPVTDKIQISLGTTVGKVMATLFNAIGQVVLQEEFKGASHSLSVSQLPAGVYLLHLQAGTTVHTEKVQIQH